MMEWLWNPWAMFQATHIPLSGLEILVIVLLTATVIWLKRTSR